MKVMEGQHNRHFRIILETGELITVSQEDGSRLKISYGDSGAPGPENTTETDIIEVKA